ncbi:Tetratricopeptide repeat-containing protein [Streptomyces sp. Ncost-T6T-2b]|nr:Tetratricopeptide repeat-containing protein [Streptomyces sp. Ncost-T6T-2b]
MGALTLLRPLLEEFAGDRAVRTLAARAYFASAQLKRAEAQLAPLVEEYPDDAFARLLYGRTLQRQNRSEEAEPHMRLAEAASA